MCLSVSFCVYGYASILSTFSVKDMLCLFFLDVFLDMNNRCRQSSDCYINSLGIKMDLYIINAVSDFKIFIFSFKRTQINIFFIFIKYLNNYQNFTFGELWIMINIIKQYTSKIFTFKQHFTNFIQIQHLYCV